MTAHGVIYIALVTAITIGAAVKCSRNEITIGSTPTPHTDEIHASHHLVHRVQANR